MGRGTPLRNVRVADPLWSDARVTAERRGETVSEVVRRALTEYVQASAEDPQD